VTRSAATLAVLLTAIGDFGFVDQLTCVTVSPSRRSAVTLAVLPPPRAIGWFFCFDITVRSGCTLPFPLQSTVCVVCLPLLTAF
jgi:hypothetical protein